jgi:hypothetical protein
MDDVVDLTCPSVKDIHTTMVTSGDYGLSPIMKTNISGSPFIGLDGKRFYSL